jgi:hypothetical protein
MAMPQPAQKQMPVRRVGPLTIRGASGVSFACEKAKIVAVHKISGKNIMKARKEIFDRLHRNAKEAQ